MISIIKIKRKRTALEMVLSVKFICDDKNKALSGSILSDIIQCSYCTSVNIKLPKDIFDGKECVMVCARNNYTEDVYAKLIY